MSELLIQNARIFDGHQAECPTGQSVLVAGDRIQAIGPQLEAPPGATVIDAGGRTLMPGLIDCHIHAYASSLSVQLE
ncbi:MAG: amidohydrolase family protein, partial [Rhodoferax sp.]